MEMKSGAMPSDEEFEIEVLALSGSTIAKLKLPGDAAVAELKERIAETSGISSSMQTLAFPSRQLEDGERLGSLSPQSAEISVILILKDSPPIDFKINGRQYQITSVQVRVGDEVADAHLAESPHNILERLASGDPQKTHGAILFWDDIPMDGAEPLRQILAEIVAQLESRGGVASPTLDGSVVSLSLKPNPSPLPQSSILFGLPSGKFYGSHPVGAHPSGTWGWIRLADDNVCGLRLMSHPSCGNTEPSGTFLAEYLGTIRQRTAVGAATRTYQTARLLASRSLPRDGDFEATVEILHLGRGRMAVHQHAPLEALEVRAAPDFDLISVQTDGIEIITIPMAGVLLPDGGQVLPPPDAALPPGGPNFLRISSCAHLNRAPRRYDPTWFERKMRHWMFG